MESGPKRCCIGQANAMKMALLFENKDLIIQERDPEEISHFLPFLTSTCSSIRTDVNGVQRRTKKGVCGKSLIYSVWVGLL